MERYGDALHAADQRSGAVGSEVTPLYGIKDLSQQGPSLIAFGS